MYPVIFPIAVGNLRPIIRFNCKDRAGVLFNGTGIVSVKFFMAKIKDDRTLDTPILNGVAGAVTQANPLVLSYTWVGTDTASAGRYACWMEAYWGAASTLPQTFDGPIVKIYTPGTQVVI